MPLQNRVTPMGDIIADAARGTLMGNRGILHNASRQLGAARWRHRSWICCRLSFKNRRRQVMAPGRYTELFFLDEATALAAGHRPCCECRRVSSRFSGGVAPGCWNAGRLRRRHRPRSARSAGGSPHAPPDPVRDAARRSARWRLRPASRRSVAPVPGPGRRPAAVATGGLWRARPRPSGTGCVVLTPRPTLAVLRAGYAPSLHSTAIRR